MDLEDDYFWSKNKRPTKSQNHDRNANIDHCLAHLKDKSRIVKSYHIWTGENQFTNRYHEKIDRTTMSKDLKPFVMYSMNKRNNWEIENFDRVELMRQIQNSHKGEDVMLLERVAMRSYEYPICLRYEFRWDDFKIRNMHKLDSYVPGRPAYQLIQVDSVFGHHPSSFLEFNRMPNKEKSDLKREEHLNKLNSEKRTVVVYHLIKPPDNYKTLFKKEFGRDNLYSCRWKDTSYWERKRKEVMRNLELRYDLSDDSEDFSEDEIEDDSSVDTEETSKRMYYNLLDHVREDFVFVKPTQNKKKKKKKKKEI